MKGSRKPRFQRRNFEEEERAKKHKRFDPRAVVVYRARGIGEPQGVVDEGFFRRDGER